MFANSKMQRLLNENISSIIRIQAFFRKVLARDAIRECIEMRDTYRMHARYFAREELFETVSRVKVLSTVTKVKSYTYKNGAVYEGEWLGGFRNGKGKITWSDGATYEGNWQLGYAHGKGTFMDCLGNRYEGNFVLSMAHGHGTYTNTLGATYEGSWKFDMQDGEGIERWNESSYFKGWFKDGLRSGFGEWKHKNKKYEG